MKYLKHRIDYINESKIEKTYKTEKDSILYLNNKKLYNTPFKQSYETKTYIKFGKSDINDKGVLKIKLDEKFNASIEAEETGLKSLENFPSNEINGSLIIHDNHLTNLENCPKIIYNNLSVDGNKLTSLKGCPETIHGNFELSNNFIKTLEDINKLSCGDLILDGNIELISIKGASNIFTDKLCLNGCIKLTEIIELPKGLTVLEINNTNIKSLKSLHDNKLKVDYIDSDDIGQFEKSFYYNYMTHDFNFKSYEQKIVNHLINVSEKIYNEFKDFNITDTLKTLHLDFSKCKIPDKYLNVFKSSKGINKFNL